ncbi:MAG: hypothetical protein GY878_10175 [Fuerstiella sp.]|nr:hypothetical protein [Fuerstiella sp.]
MHVGIGAEGGRRIELSHSRAIQSLHPALRFNLLERYPVHIWRAVVKSTDTISMPQNIQSIDPVVERVESIAGRESHPLDINTFRGAQFLDLTG